MHVSSCEICLIFSQSDFFVTNLVLAMAPFHGEIKRLIVHGHCKAHSRSESKLKFRCEQIVNV